MTSSNTARARRSPIVEGWRLQSEETKSETVNRPRPEAGPQGDAPGSALEREATGATGDPQSVGHLAAESAEDPQATLIQHTASDLIKAEFLWNPYLLADEFCTVAGPKGAGKSWIAMAIATRVAMATGFPGDESQKAARWRVY